MKTYAEKLRDPRWQKKRLGIMERDNFTCQHCRLKDNTLNVHHRIYRKGKSPWDYEDDVFVTLCESCHETAEAYKEYVLMSLARGQLNDMKIAAMASTLSQGPEESFFLSWATHSLAHCIGKFNLLRGGNDESSTDELIDQFQYNMGECIEHLYTSLFAIRKNFQS